METQQPVELKRPFDDLSPLCSSEYPSFGCHKKIRMSHKLCSEYGGAKFSNTSQSHHPTHVSPPPANKSPPKPMHLQSNAALTDQVDDIPESSKDKVTPGLTHPPWKNYRVISGHLGWVRSVAFDPSNAWFCTGSADRSIKIWDLASGRLKLTLTGHSGQVRGLAVSARQPYLFSAGDDKQVKCWDMEQNKVIRSFHGHLSGVYSLALHPTLDILMTGGRDSVCRVWDVRTKMQIHALSGHTDTVCSLFARGTDPQVVTGSSDSTIRLWDIRNGKTMVTLTHHKKSVRAMVVHPKEDCFVSASADSVKKFKLPRGEFCCSMSTQQKSIVNAMAINEDGVLVSGGDDGNMTFWDWKSGRSFQRAQSVAQPGSLDCEAGIYALSFDITGSRLVSCEADKTIKMWKKVEA